jgi:C-terminal processing protease CtpA/Prc
MARDRVVEIDGQPVGSHDDMLRRFREAGGQVDVVVERNGRRVSARARRQPAE